MKSKMTIYLKVSSFLTVATIAIGLTNCQDKSKKVDAASSSCPADFVKDYNEKYITIGSSLKTLKSDIEKKTVTCKPEINSVHKELLASCDAMVKKYDKLDCVVRKTEGGESEKMTTEKLKSTCVDYKKTAESTICPPDAAGKSGQPVSGTGAGTGSGAGSAPIEQKTDISVKYAETTATVHADLLKNILGVWASEDASQATALMLIEISAEKGFGQAMLDKSAIEGKDFKGIGDSAYSYKAIRLSKEIPTDALIAADIAIDPSLAGYRMMDLSGSTSTEAGKVDSARILVRLYLQKPGAKRMDVIFGTLVNGVYKFNVSTMKTYAPLEKKAPTVPVADTKK